MPSELTNSVPSGAAATISLLVSKAFLAFIKAKLVGTNFTYSDVNRITVEFPFDRFYMDEFEAKDAENVHREASRDTASLTYAMVYIHRGKAVLNDVFIDEVSIRDLVETE